MGRITKKNKCTCSAETNIFDLQLAESMEAAPMNQHQVGIWIFKVGGVSCQLSVCFPAITKSLLLLVFIHEG